MSVLSVVGLHKSYEGKPLVRDISLSVSQGQIVGLLGPNGAGKTSCFYMIVGLLSVDKGSILVDQQDISHLPVYKRAGFGISYLPQENSIFRRLTVYENVCLALEMMNSVDNVDTACQALLEQLGIMGIRDRKAYLLSGGERRRVELARAMAMQPRFILLDEPFSGVDPIAVQDMKALFFYLKQCNIGVLITDHNVRETLSICDSAYILNEGAVLAAGSVPHVVANEEVRKYYLGNEFQL